MAPSTTTWPMMRLLLTRADAVLAYTPVGRLVSYREPGAGMTDVVERARRIATVEATADANGNLIWVQADTRSVLSDTPESVQLAASLRQTRADVPVGVRALA